MPDQAAHDTRSRRVRYATRVALPLVATAALLWAVLSSLSVYPHSLSYFNELAGGPDNGHKHLVHSNLDWGQDMLLVREWLRERGIPSRDVRVVSYSPTLTRRGLLAPDLAQESAVRWEILSPNQLVDPDARWRARIMSRSAQRIGYVMWAFPVDASNEQEYDR